MKVRIFLTLSLFIVLLGAGCAPASTEVVDQPVVAVPVETNISPPVDSPSPTLPVAMQPSVELTATLTVDVLPAATSRGPELHATDPTTVSLATGQLHFVEFFRFT